jgi:hypothetical protein
MTHVTGTRRFSESRSPDWLKMNPNAPAVRREAEEDWGRTRPRNGAGP